MKSGVLISIAIVAIFIVALLATFYGKADDPTSVTAAPKLVAQQWPDSLPSIYLATNSSESAAEQYYAAFEFYKKHRRELVDSNPNRKLIEQFGNLMVKAMNAGSVSTGFLDKQTSISLPDQMEYEESLDVSAAILFAAADQAFRAKKQDHAMDCVKAAFALGHRAFTKNTLLYPRRAGLRAMIDSLNMLESMADNDAALMKAIRANLDAANQVQAAWEPKFEVVLAAQPHVGDLLNIAENDKDLSFRVQAVRWLGVAKFRPGGRGNARVIAATIKSMKNDSNDLVRQAADAADKLTLDGLRSIR